MNVSEVVYGSCLHGRSLQILGSTVYFVEPCAACVPILRSEGYSVLASAPVTLAA